MSESLTKSEFIEREMKEWEEHFEIPFQSKYKVRMLHELRYTYGKTPDDHIKSKREIIEGIVRLERELNLKPKQKEDRRNLTEKVHVIIVVNQEKFTATLDLFRGLVESNLEVVSTNKYSAKLTTGKYQILLGTPSESLRGKRCDVLLNLTKDNEIENMVREFSNRKPL